MLGEELAFHMPKSQGNCGDTNKAPIRVPSEHIIPADSIVINKELGVGEFGVVQQGVWTNEDGERVQVAIKCLNEQRMQNNPLEFLKEAAIMHSIDHEHIVRLYGVVLEKNALMLVTELAPLRSLLECLKEPALRSTFTILSLCDFAVQICEGMAYLESKRLIHRDLAARNILVFAKNRVKISDFGLSRALGVGKDYYQTNFNVNLKLPIAWCAPECINYLKFTSASDVWAYGVTLWEMFSYGFQPWAALTGQQILEAIDEPSFQRLEQPECCPKEYYSIMLRCWEHDPNKRPKFSEISKVLPDCRPELVQIVKDMPELSSSSASFSDSNSPAKCKKQYLQCKVGDIITVLDKRLCFSSSSFSTSSNGISSSAESSTNLWKGALNNGKTGLFNPSCTVAYLGQNLPTSSHTATITNSNSGYSTAIMSFIRGILDGKGGSSHNSSSNIYSSKRRLRPEMISKPQGDLKHTGHVGADGAFFGDISFLDTFLGDKYHQLPKQLGATLKQSTDNKIDRGSLGRHSSDLSDRTPLISKCNNSSLLEEKNFSSLRSEKVNEKSKSSSKPIKNGTSNVHEHEYHEISNEDDLTSLESPHFETLDFGPSLMDEVLKEFDIIKPEFTDELTEQQKAINDCNSNVKNEIIEIANKLALTKDNKKKQGTVKPISPADEEAIDSALNMAKEFAARSMLELEFKPVSELKSSVENGSGLSDSPKTPTSPNKKKFSFKLKIPKIERRTFSSETENISDIESIVTEDAKKAYSTLIEKGEGLDKTRSSFIEKSCSSDTDTRRHTYNPVPTAISSINLPSSHITSIDPESISAESNPLRLLRNGASIIPKVKGNKQRIPATPQTASLARLTANVNRSSLGSPPPVPVTSASIPSLSSSLASTTLGNTDDLSTQNALPLPPRDRSKQQPKLKQHQRKYPLIIPTNNQNFVSEPNGSPEVTPTETIMSTFKPNLPVLKQVLYNEPTSKCVNNINRKSTDNTEEKCSSPTVTLSPIKSVPMPPPKPNRSYLHGDRVDSAVDRSTFDNQDSLTMPKNSSAAKELQNNISTNESSSKEHVTNHHVSCEDLLDFAADKPSLKPEKSKGIDSDEVRVMLKILGNDVTAIECLSMLNVTDWDTFRAIKCIKLGRQLKSHSIDVACARLAETLAKFSENRHQAYNYLVATHGLPEDTTEV